MTTDHYQLLMMPVFAAAAAARRGCAVLCCAVLCCILHVTIIRHLLLPVCSLVTGVLVSSFGTLEVSRGGGDFTGIVCII